MEPDPVTVDSPSYEKQKLSFWRKIGGGSLTISIIIHAIALALGVYIVVQVIPEPEEPPVDFLPKSGGGGAAGPPNPGQKVRVSAPSSANRIAARGAESAFSLPEPDASSDMNSLSALDGGAMSGGMGGSGFGGGRGDGHGLGVGDGMGIGIGGGAGIGNPFGVADAKAEGLIGVLYDLKQTKFGKSVGDQSSRSQNQRNDEVTEIVKEFANRWNERTLEKFYRAKQELKQTRIIFPRINASDAPKAFQCENEVQPRRISILYKGNVIAPKTGKFRFVGMGDDVLLVRFNNKLVFDFGYTFATLGVNRYELDRAGNTISEVIQNKVKGTPQNFPLKWPLEIRQYPTLKAYNHALGGLAVGADFEVQQGKSYPIEIFLTEIPGGAFSALLLIEEEGATYEKTENGVPIIPIFRTDATLPSAKGSLVPPFDKNSPIWRVASGPSRLDI
ncbi:MAG: hypothetical protein QM627_01015 [Luteolibacter sp.]